MLLQGSPLCPWLPFPAPPFPGAGAVLWHRPPTLVTANVLLKVRDRAENGSCLQPSGAWVWTRPRAPRAGRDPTGPFLAEQPRLGFPPVKWGWRYEAALWSSPQAAASFLPDGTQKGKPGKGKVPCMWRCPRRWGQDGRGGP